MFKKLALAAVVALGLGSVSAATAEQKEKAVETLAALAENQGYISQENVEQVAASFNLNSKENKQFVLGAVAALATVGVVYVGYTYGSKFFKKAEVKEVEVNESEGAKKPEGENQEGIIEEVPAVITEEDAA